MQRVSICVIGSLIVIATAGTASATNGWSRKYNVACTACHVEAAMPRLNYYGEQFEHNGYQMVGEQDGDDAGKTRIKNTLLDEIGYLFSIRFQMTPLRYSTNSSTDNSLNVKDSVDVGVIDHMNLFFAGSIFKNVGIYINTELPGSDSEPVFHKQFNLGVHNIAGSSWLNAKIGRLPPMQVSANSARAPMFPGIEIGQVFTLRTSGGRGDDSVNTRGGRPSAVLFGHGHFGPAYGYYSIGVEQGRNMEDPNRQKNVWGTIGVGAHHGPLEGSNVSAFAYIGKDTKDQLDDMDEVVARHTNNFRRYVGSANLRFEGIDIVASYLYGTEDNFLLTARDMRTAVNYHGVVVMGGRALNAKWYAGAQYDLVKSNDDEYDRFRFNKITPSVSYSPIDNLRILLMGMIDLDDDGPRQHSFFITGRAML